MRCAPLDRARRCLFGLHQCCKAWHLCSDATDTHLQVLPRSREQNKVCQDPAHAISADASTRHAIVFDARHYSRPWHGRILVLSTEMQPNSEMAHSLCHAFSPAVACHYIVSRSHSQSARHYRGRSTSGVGCHIQKTLRWKDQRNQGSGSSSCKALWIAAWNDQVSHHRPINPEQSVSAVQPDARAIVASSRIAAFVSLVMCRMVQCRMVWVNSRDWTAFVAVWE